METAAPRLPRRAGEPRHAVAIGIALQRSFRRRAVWRLLRFLLGIVFFFALFVYTLAWAAIPIATAEGWTHNPVSSAQIDFAGITATLPTFPYITVALLLAVVASAALIAFAITEDRYSTAFNEVLVSRPAQECLALAAPYRDLCGE